MLIGVCAETLACSKSSGYVNTVAVVPAIAPAVNRAAICAPSDVSCSDIPNARSAIAWYHGNTAKVVAEYGKIRTTAAPVPLQSAPIPSVCAIRDATCHATDEGIFGVVTPPPITAFTPLALT